MAVTAHGAALREIDVPEPDVPPGHALVEVLTCGVCATDLKIVAGDMAFSARQRLPHVPGHEVYGRVVRTEPAGLVPTGTTVVVYQYRPCGRCDSCRRGDEVLCLDMRGWTGFVDPGGFQERVAAAVDRLVVVPPSIPAAEAAPLTCAIGTAFRATVSRGRVGLGDVVLVLGLGGVGIHAAQFAIAAGATAIGVDTHGPTIERARALGILAVVAGDGLREALSAHAPTGVDVAIDTVASADTIELGAASVRRGGRFVEVAHGAAADVTISSRRLVLDEIEVVGSRYARRDEMAHAVAAVASGRVRPVVGTVAPLAAANDVLAALARGDVVGRAVLDVAGVT
jgi:D-arabinose 1-dehydrogenase-like Zn-dependent alcohol dehydrogenase